MLGLGNKLLIKNFPNLISKNFFVGNFVKCGNILSSPLCLCLPWRIRQLLEKTGVFVVIIESTLHHHN